MDLRINPLSKRKIIVSPRRSKRPEEKNGVKPVCPFCYGNELMTPPEVFRIGEGQSGESGWQVRVVPNKFSITDIHEVIIHSPDHSKKIQDLEESHIEMVLKAYKERYLANRDKGQVIIFNNTGKSAGESLEHNHSQLTVVPSDVQLDSYVWDRSLEDLAYKGKSFDVYAPYYSEWPYEVIIRPQRRNLSYGEINDEEIKELAGVLKRLIILFKQDLGEFSYNYYIHWGEDWFLRFIPRIVVRAGFEIASGIKVNIKDPAEVKELLKTQF